MAEDKPFKDNIDNLLRDMSSAEQGESLFAALKPAEPLPRDDKPAVLAYEDTINLLRAKVEELERKLEAASKAQENASRQKSGEPKPLPPNQELIAFFKSRMEELEKKLYGVQEKALYATLELKNREESQKEARKESEEILRAIREQQRSEHDRRLKERLEKADARIEELEKRLLEVSLRGKDEEAALTGKLAGAVENLKSLVGENIAALSEAVGKLGVTVACNAAEQKTAVEERLSALEKFLNERLSRQDAEIRKDFNKQLRDLRESEGGGKPDVEAALNRLGENAAFLVREREEKFEAKLAELRQLLQGGACAKEEEWVKWRQEISAALNANAEVLAESSEKFEQGVSEFKKAVLDNLESYGKSEAKGAQQRHLSAINRWSMIGFICHTMEGLEKRNRELNENMSSVLSGLEQIPREIGSSAFGRILARQIDKVRESLAKLGSEISVFSSLKSEIKSKLEEAFGRQE